MKISKKVAAFATLALQNCINSLIVLPLNSPAIK